MEKKAPEKETEVIRFRDVETGQWHEARRSDILTRETLFEVMHKKLDGEEPSHEMLKQICVYMDFALGLGDFAFVSAFYYELKRIVFDNAKRAQGKSVQIPCAKVNSIISVLRKISDPEFALMLEAILAEKNYRYIQSLLV